MRKFRIVVVFLLSAVIVFGIWKYYTVNQHIYFQDPVSPLWERLTTTFELQPMPEQLATGSSGDRIGLLARLFSQTNLTHERDTLHPDFSTGDVDMREVASLLDTRLIAGAEQGEIVMIEYCDFAARYCQQAATEGMVDNLLAEYPDALQYTFVSYPSSLTRRSLMPHIAAACVADRGSENQYFVYLKSLYESEDRSQLINLTSLATQVGVNNKFAACVQQNRHALALRQKMKRSNQLFTIDALPTYIFLNKETGAYIKLPGLYEEEEILFAIDQLQGVQ